MKKLAAYCDAVLDLKNAGLNDVLFYASLPLCIFDAVFSIGARYISTRNVVRRYCQNFALDMFYSSDVGYPDVHKQHTVSAMLANIDNYGVNTFAEQVIKNRQRTSSRSGILKAEAVYKWARVLKAHNIETLQDAFNISPQVENELKQITGQVSGISLLYFHMLVGSRDICKPDRHILTFLSDVLGEKVSDIDMAQALMQNATQELRRVHSHLTVRVLDHEIWKYMSGKSGGTCRMVDCDGDI